MTDSVKFIPALFWSEANEEQFESRLNRVELCSTCGEPIPACDCPNKSLDE